MTFWSRWGNCFTGEITVVGKMIQRGVMEQQQMDEVYCEIFRHDAAVLPVENEPQQNCNQIRVSEAFFEELLSEIIDSSLTLVPTATV